MGEGTSASAEQLVSSLSAHYFKIERLVELADVVGSEPQSQHYFAIRIYHPSELVESEMVAELDFHQIMIEKYDDH